MKWHRKRQGMQSLAFSLFLPGSFAIPRTDSQPVDMDDAVVEFDLGAVVSLEPVDI